MLYRLISVINFIWAKLYKIYWGVIYLVWEDMIFVIYIYLNNRWWTFIANFTDNISDSLTFHWLPVGKTNLRAQGHCSADDDISILAFEPSLRRVQKRVKQ